MTHLELLKFAQSLLAENIALRQKLEAATPKCSGCDKTQAGGWALYCVRCCEDSMVAAAVAEEREACIEDCEALGDSWRQGYLDGVKSCIAVIRARGEK